MDGTAAYIFIGRRICTKELIHAFPPGKSAAVTLSRGGDGRGCGSNGEDEVGSAAVLAAAATQQQLNSSSNRSCGTVDHLKKKATRTAFA